MECAAILVLLVGVETDAFRLPKQSLSLAAVGLGSMSPTLVQAQGTGCTPECETQWLATCGGSDGYWCQNNEAWRCFVDLHVGAPQYLDACAAGCAPTDVMLDAGCASRGGTCEGTKAGFDDVPDPCAGDGSSNAGCDGVANSGKVLDACGVCPSLEPRDSLYTLCAPPECDGATSSGDVDACVCAGDGSFKDCAGVCYAAYGNGNSVLQNTFCNGHRGGFCSTIDQDTIDALAWHWLDYGKLHGLEANPETCAAAYARGERPPVIDAPSSKKGNSESASTPLIVGICVAAGVLLFGVAFVVRKRSVKARQHRGESMPNVVADVIDA